MTKKEYIIIAIAFWALGCFLIALAGAATSASAVVAWWFALGFWAMAAVNFAKAMMS